MPGNTAIVYMFKRNQITETSEIFCVKMQPTYYPKMALVHVSTTNYREDNTNVYRKSIQYEGPSF